VSERYLAEWIWHGPHPPKALRKPRAERRRRSRFARPDLLSRRSRRIIPLRLIELPARLA